MANKNKKLFFVWLPMILAGFVFSALPAWGADFGLSQIGNAIGLGGDDPRVMIARIINIALGFLGVIALGFVLYAGFLWLTSAGDEEKINKAKKILISAVVGLAIILSAWGITLFVLQKLGAVTGVNINGGGDDNGDGNGPPASALLVKSITPQGEVQICNPVARIKFNKSIDPNTVEGNIIISANSSAGWRTIAGTLKIDGAWVEFRPNSDCPAPYGDKKCWQFNDDPTTEYSINVSNGVKAADGSSLWCGIGYECNGSFTILQGCFVDASSPIVRMTYPFNGQPICSDGTAVKALAKDDTGIGRVDFYVDNNYLDGDAPSEANSESFEAEVWWETGGLAIGSSHKLKAQAFDLDDNNAWSKETSVKIFPAHCCNGVQDSGETGIDCGGECLACTGDDCDSGDDNLDTCVQPDHQQCISQYCRADNCSCLALPLITDVNPMDGAFGNLITIWGQDFGQEAGKVIFLGGDENENCLGLAPKSVNSACTDYWQNDQIIIVVPSCGQTGPIKVVTNVGLYDRTDDWRGPDLGDFEINDIVRPGLCLLDPSQGRFNDAITLQGINFGAQAKQVWFGNPLGKNKIKAQAINNWSNQTITAVVPNLKSGKVPVYAEAFSGQFSNGVNFKVSSTDAGQKTPCDSNPGTSQCDADSDLCPAGEFCDSNTCLCAVGDGNDGNPPAGGEYCDADANNPGCQTDVNLCSTAKPFCDQLSCECQPYQDCSYVWSFTTAERTLCDSDSANPGCQADRNLCAEGEECREDCFCYAEETPPTPPDGEVEYCDSDAQNPGCQADADMCSAEQPFCDQLSCECQPYQSCKYVWTFKTGSPFVIEECVDYNKEGAPSPSPTPWSKVSSNVCINVLVSARFSEPVDEQSVKNNVKVQIDCSGAKSEADCPAEGDGCYWANSQCVSQPLAGYVHVYEWDTDNHYGAFKFYKGVINSSDRSENYLPNTKYQVTLIGGPNGIKTKAGVPLIDDYIWSFQTRDSNQLCKLDKVKVVPFNAKLVIKDALQNYLGETYTKEDSCLLLNSDSYDWDWWSEDASKGKIDDQDSDPKNSKNNVRAVGESPSPIKIYARIESEKKEGYGNLIIEFANFVLLKHWPCGDANGQNVCPNALIGAEFNRQVDRKSFGVNESDGSVSGDSIQIYSCDKGSDCNLNILPFSKGSNWDREQNLRADFFFDAGTGNEEINVSTTPSLLKIGNYYRIIFKDNSQGIKNYLGEELDNPNYDSARGEECEGESAICKNCLNQGLTVACSETTKTNCCGDKIKEPGEDCDDGNNYPGDGCSNVCLNEGSNFKNQCGNGNDQDLGEDPGCDTANGIFSGCNDHCVFKGSFAPAICGDGVVDKAHGEECDQKGQATNGDGCSGKCLFEGIIKNEEGEEDPTKSTKECEPNTQGCDAKGVHLGTLPKVTCGNGKIEIGEDCDDGNTIKGDGCSDFCLNEGSNKFWGSTCGNKVVEGPELDSYSWYFRVKETPGLCQLSSVDVKPEKMTAEVNETINYQADAYGETDVCEPKGQKLRPEDYLWNWWSGDAKKAVVNPSSNNQTAVMTIAETGDTPVKVFASVKDKSGDNAKNDFGELSIVGQGIKGGELCEAKKPNYQYNPDAPAVCPVEVPDCGPVEIYQCLVGDTTGDVCKTYDDCPRCCCEPKKKYKNLTCEPDQDECTGSTRGLYCGCQKDLDCTEVYGDKYGCGFSDPAKCCHPRPWITDCDPTLEFTGVQSSEDTWCKSGNNNFCPNGLIKVYFDQVIKPESLANNNFAVVTRLITKDDGECPKGTIPTGQIDLAFNNSEENGFFSRALGALNDGLNKLFGREAKAEMVEFCQVTGDIYAYQLSAKDETTEEVKYFTEAIFSPDENLEFSRVYYALVAGDDLGTGDEGEGVVSIKGVGMDLKESSNGGWVPAGQKSGNNFFWSFTTKADFCPIDRVNVYINGNEKPAISDLFNCTKDDCPDDFSQSKTGNQHHYYAEALDKDGQEIKADFKWQEIDAGGAIEVGEVDTDQPDQKIRYITANPKEDAQAYLDVIASEDFANSTANQLIDVRVFDCANPWPALPDDIYSWQPWQDDVTNFQFYYCRDRGAIGTSDDLPALANPPVIVNGTGEILKEFLFAVLDSDVVGFRVLKNAGKNQKICSNDCQKSCLDDTECSGGYCLRQFAHLSPGLWYTFPCNVPDPGSPQSLEVDGYKAVRDGRTTYASAANSTPAEIFTNIYLVSYNEGAKADTQTIYNQILGHWHFNTNLDDYRACRDADGELLTFVPCDNDLVCQPLGYCDARKTKITRDTIRLGDLNDLAHLLEAYYKKKEAKEGQGDYPALAGGSYIKGLSTSKWPISWGLTLKGELGKDLPLDPLNLFGADCSLKDGYEASTCWNETKKDFYLSPYSDIYIYKYFPLTTSAPVNYHLCAELEFRGDGFGLHNMADQWFGLPDSAVWDYKQLKFGLSQCYP
ncbi:MAG: hypothetical protein V1684_01205 [bacterium]